MRERWFGATGIRVPEIAVEGLEIDLVGSGSARFAGEVYEVLIVDGALDKEALSRAHARGIPVVARAQSPEAVRDALANPEVACAVVPESARDLRELDLTELTYG